MIKVDLSFYLQKIIIYFYSVIAGGIVARAFSSARNAILLPCRLVENTLVAEQSILRVIFAM